MTLSHANVCLQLLDHTPIGIGRLAQGASALTAH